MKTKILRNLFTLFFTVLIMFILSTKIQASSMSVSASKYTVSPGESFTVTVSVSNGAGSINVSASNGSVSSSSAWIDNSSASFTCTAGSSGSVKVSVTGNFADYTTGEDEATKYGSATVTIQSESSSSESSGTSSNSGGSSNSSSTSNKSTNKSTTNNTTKKTETEVKKSNDVTLSALSLELEGVTFEPEFAKDVLEYTVTVPNEITTFEVYATPSDSKASVEVAGNTDFQIGDNTLTIKVTAEDGTIQTYTIKVKREREKLALKTLVIKYEDENGNVFELPLNPSFISNIYEYTLEDISYKINKLLIECEANLEGVTIEMSGNEELKAGENIITITLTVPVELDHELQEGEEKPEDEKIIYTIKVSKEETPTFWQKIKNKIKVIFGTISNWYNNNNKKIIVSSLGLCVAAMLGLSVYIVIDAKKYKVLLQKLNKVSEINSMKPETINEISVEDNTESENIIEDISNDTENDTTDNNKKGGRHF